jgi:hypothetical protein
MEDNIEMNLRDIGRGGTDWANLALDRDRWRRTFGFSKMLGVLE